MAGKNFLTKSLKKYFKKVKAFFEMRNALTFFVFLIISAFVWFLSALDKEQTAIINYPIKFTGIPQNILVTNPLPKHITLSLRDKGRQFVKYYENLEHTFTVDLSGRKFFESGEILITPDQIIRQSVSILQPTTTVEKFSPDSIFINYQRLNTKEVTVMPNLAIELEQQYMLSSEIAISPEKITVFAPKNINDTLQYVYTELITLNKLKDTTVVTAKLRPLKNVRFSVTQVKIKLNVEMFTEKKLQIPVKVINCPSNISIKTFPAIITAKCNVGLKRFSSVSANDLQAIFDYNDIKQGNSDKIKITGRSLASDVSNVQLTPNEVEFIIEKK